MLHPISQDTQNCNYNNRICLQPIYVCEKGRRKYHEHCLIALIRRFIDTSLGSETRATKKGQEKRLEVNEMRMLRWTCGVTKTDIIR